MKTPGYSKILFFSAVVSAPKTVIPTSLGRDIPIRQCWARET